VPTTADNACKFTPAGGRIGVTVAVCPPPTAEEAATAEREPRTSDAPPQQWLRITVADTGVGVPFDQQWRLFRPFSQVLQASAPSAKPMGTGLGLVLSQSFIRHMGGDITFSSQPGAGTTFTIVVPFNLEAEDLARSGDAAHADAAALAGVAVVALLSDAPLAEATTCMAATWGASTPVLPDAQRRDALEELARSSERALLLVVDPPAHALLCGPGAPPLPSRAACVLAAPPAEQTAWRCDAAAPERGRGVAPAALLDLPASPGRLLSRLCAAADAAAAPSAPVTPVAAAEPAAAAAEPALDAAPLRVLMAEDNAMNVRVARAVLARCGVTELRVVGDGEAAVAAFLEAGAASLPWSCIFMDMQMPLLNGPEAARAIRALEAASGAAPTWIVAVTANSGQEDRRECQEAGAQPLRCCRVRRKLRVLHSRRVLASACAAGMNDFILKPITPAGMRLALGRIPTAA
jgi:CheY-like chemotaxis protein